MKDRRDLDDVAPQAVHDSIAAVDDLAEGLVTNLAYYPSGQQMRSPRRPRSPGVPRRPGSPEKPALHLGVIYAFASVQFRQPTLDLRQEDEPFYSVLKRRIRWQLLDCLESLLFGSTP